MRIAHVSDCYLPRLGGIELQVHDLAQRQSDAGHDVTVITTTAGRKGLGLSGGAKIVRVGGGPANKPEAIRYRSSFKVRQQVRFDEFDVVHVHASAFSPLAFLSAHKAARMGVPTVATLHSLWAGATPLFRIANRLTRWANWPVEWSAVSNTAASSLRAVLDEGSVVTVLPNGVSPEDWKVKPVPRDGSDLRVTAVMRLSHRKRPLQLAEVLKQAQSRLPQDCRLRVDIVGDGPERQRLERFLKKNDMTDWVNLRGRLSRSEIRSTLARSDVFLAPALLESFGIAALEARCAGVPIIAMTGTGVADFVGHEQEGWLVDSDESMADTIVRVATSPATLAGVASHNRCVPPKITWSVVLSCCESLYQAAARRQGLPTVAAGSDGAMGVAALSQ